MGWPRLRCGGDGGAVMAQFGGDAVVAGFVCEEQRPSTRGKSGERGRGEERG